MELNDFNIHLYSKAKGSLVDQIKSDTELTAIELLENFYANLSHFKSEHIESANFHLFNQQVLWDPAIRDFMGIVQNEMPGSAFTLLCDFRQQNRFDYVKQAKDVGFSFLKFHCYVQMIQEQDYSDILEMCLYAQELRMGICVDSSFGTLGLYKFDNLKLAAEIIAAVKNVPIILLHSGGSRVLEAMLIADLEPNVYLETSLSLHFYEGSSIMRDFAFAYKKIGYDRVLFASDYPYQSINEAKLTFSNFCEAHDITESAKNEIINYNFRRVLSLLN